MPCPSPAPTPSPTSWPRSRKRPADRVPRWARARARRAHAGSGLRGRRRRRGLRRLGCGGGRFLGGLLLRLGQGGSIRVPTAAVRGLGGGGRACSLAHECEEVTPV